VGSGGRAGKFASRYKSHDFNLNLLLDTKAMILIWMSVTLFNLWVNYSYTALQITSTKFNINHCFLRRCEGRLLGLLGLMLIHQHFDLVRLSHTIPLFQNKMFWGFYQNKNDALVFTLYVWKTELQILPKFKKNYTYLAWNIITSVINLINTPYALPMYCLWFQELSIKIRH